jgi:superfamily I DNA/RNA helicase
MSSSQKKMATFEDLSPEQQRVVSEWGKGLAVMAGAGSGKTTTLVIKCAELLKKNPEAQFAAVSFTEKSASDLRAKLTQRRKF